MTSPYDNLPRRAYWRTAVTERAPLDPGDLYQPRFPIGRRDRIVTAGSCFAQHVGRALDRAGFDVLDAEPAPAAFSDALAQRFGYRLYSARYGNIYTARQLIQLWREATGAFEPADAVWCKDGRYFDALRPGVEPEGLDSAATVRAHRAEHLGHVRAVFAQADLFVFTFGLTETWEDRATGTVYPTAPGTIAGRYDPDRHAFRNLTFAEVLDDFVAFRAAMKTLNPAMKFLVTVSPVPLTATASGRHVEVATCHSKSILRAVCAEIVGSFDDCDYFPSYEIITSTNNRGVYFDANKRTVSKLGVATAMGVFLSAHGGAPSASAARPSAAARGEAAAQAAAEAAEAVVCEEALLEAFAR